MALLQHHSLALFSLLVPGMPLVIHRPVYFHRMPLPEKPQVICRLAKYHCFVVSQHSSLDPFTSTLPEKPPIVHRKSNFHPPMWDNHFIESLNGSHQESEAFNEKRIGALKEKVKTLLISENDILQKMKLVDAIERLGLAYHFEKEIQLTIQQVYDDNHDYGDNLHVVALHFRLLRQHGYHVSCDVFEKFKDDEGNFKKSLRSDVRGLLSLYEASYYSIRGEDILENSLTFSRQEMSSMSSHLNPTLARRVQHSLQLLPHKCLPTLEAKKYISFYEEDEERNEVLLELAKMDFNLVQRLHQSEIKEVFRWWKELDFGEKLPYIRDRMVESYLWALGINFLPEFSNGRIALAKVINLLVVIDDTYDTYAKMDEIELFTDAINRWDIEAMDKLPEHLKLPYLELYKLVNDSEFLSMKHRENNGIYYAKKTLQDLCKGNMQEAKWSHEGYIPSMDEYLSNSLHRAVGFFMLTGAALGMGDMVDQEGLDYIVGESNLTRHVNIIARVLNDISTSKIEQEQGDVADIIQCYMVEHGVSQEEACTHMKNLVADAWKDVNKEILNCIPLPKAVVDGIINYGKLTEMFYMDGNDGFGNSQCWMKDNINSMLFEPIPM